MAEKERIDEPDSSQVTRIALPMHGHDKDIPVTEEFS